ncbi:MAG: hypothetical protein QM820_55985 [Minicystis sp.]
MRSFDNTTKALALVALAALTAGTGCTTLADDVDADETTAQAPQAVGDAIGAAWGTEGQGQGQAEQPPFEGAQLPPEEQPPQAQVQPPFAPPIGQQVGSQEAPVGEEAVPGQEIIPPGTAPGCTCNCGCAQPQQPPIAPLPPQAPPFMQAPPFQQPITAPVQAPPQQQPIIAPSQGCAGGVPGCAPIGCAGCAPTIGCASAPTGCFAGLGIPGGFHTILWPITGQFFSFPALRNGCCL